MKRLLFFLLLVGCLAGRTQHSRVADERQWALEQAIELISEDLETEDLDFTTLLEALNYYYEHPLNLNRATREELLRLYLLDEFQVEHLLRHIHRTGRLISIYELQGIEGFDLGTIRALLPFIKVSDHLDRRVLRWTEIKRDGTHEAFVRWQRVMEETEGHAPIDDSLLAEYPNKRYQGSPDRVYARYRFRYLDNISVGLTMEKDGGEAFLRDGQPKGFDYYSGHVYFGNYGILKHAVIGDYQVQLGQGLNCWTGLAFGKSSAIGSVKRTAREIIPHVSADENNFMRGAATTLALGGVEVTAFYSRKGVDANLSAPDTATGDEGEVVNAFSSFQNSGFHRTPDELEDKDAIDELNTGAHVRYGNGHFELGATGVYTRYFGTYSRTPRLYNRFEPAVNSFFLGGADYRLLVHNVLAFGEFSQHFDGGPAFLNGAILSIDPRLDVSFLHRYYAPSYSNPRGNAVGEASRNTNEQGLYFGLSSKPGRRWTFRGYYDLFTFPWLRFRADGPSSGSEYLAQLEYRPNKRVAIYGRYRFEHKEENAVVEGQPTDGLGALERQWVRCNAQYALSKSLSLRNRLEYTVVRLPGGALETGWLLYQDLVYNPWPARYSLRLRYALFDTDSYHSRIYAYEHDVLYAFSVPAYYYRGSRVYLVIGYKVARWSDLSVRWSQTFYANRDENGSGLNTIHGPTRTEVKVQWRVRL